MLDRLRADDMEAHLAGEDEEQARRFGWWPKRSGPEHFRAMLTADEHEWTGAGWRRRFAARIDGALVGGAVEADVEGDNRASRRVAEAAGFTNSGRKTPDGLLVYERRR